jgi:hypothetical protein
MEIKEETIRDWGNLIVVAGWSRKAQVVVRVPLYLLSCMLCFFSEGYRDMNKRELMTAITKLEKV